MLETKRVCCVFFTPFVFLSFIHIILSVSPSLLFTHTNIHTHSPLTPFFSLSFPPQVLFQPLTGDTCYTAEAECFIGHNDTGYPTCFPIALLGHTFTNVPLSAPSFSAPVISYAPVVVDTVAWRTVTLTNPVIRLAICR